MLEKQNKKRQMIARQKRDFIASGEIVADKKEAVIDGPAEDERGPNRLSMIL